MEELALDVPPGVDVVAGPRGLRLRGPELGLGVALQQLRRLEHQPEGVGARLGDWTLIVTDAVPDDLGDRWVALPGGAWNIAASVLTDAAFGGYGDAKVMDFGEVGFLDPPPARDVGVEIFGEFATGSFGTPEELAAAYEGELAGN